MMNSNGGFQSYYPSNEGPVNQQYNPNGYNHNSFHRTNTYMPPSPFQNPGYNQPPQMNPPQNLHHSNTFMVPKSPYACPSPPMQQQNPYMPPLVQENQMPPQPNFLHRSNTYMPPQSHLPYQNPPPQPIYPPQGQNPYNPPPPIPQPPQSPYYDLPKIQRANTYCQTEPARRPTIYDSLNIRPHKFAPENPMRMQNNYKQYGPSNFNNANNINNVIESSYFNNFPGTNDFNPEADCQVLRNAVHGWGTDEKAIINVIVNRNAAQRAEIRRTYKACFGKDLIKRLKEDTSGNFKEIICAMFMTPAEYDAYCLYKAMKGLGTNEGVLIEIIGTRNCRQLQEIKDIFEKEYKNTLENWVIGDTSGNFKLLLIALLQCNRSDNPNPDLKQCQADAQALYKAGEGRWGTDEATFIRIFANRSAAEITAINQCYMQIKGKGLLHAIDKEFSGDIKKLLQTIVGGLLDIHGYFAMRIRESVKGLGTNDSKLVRVIVSRCEIDLPQIKEAYQRIYQRDLLHDVRDDTSGYYRDILTSLISRC